MKAILKFDLDNIDDRFAHTRCLKALDLSLALNDLDSYLRNEIKHGDLSEESVTIHETIREQLYTIAKNRNINIWDLVL